ncbi:MAG: iron-containing alcohol dehydrogenase [Geminicoccaceae bacterium]
MGLIDQIIDGAWRPEGSAPWACPVKSVVINTSLDGAEPDLLAATSLKGRLAIVADPRTLEVLGNRVFQRLLARGPCDLIVIEPAAANESVIEMLAEKTRNADALVAVGSGTLNDVCKYVAFKTARPYLVFATAPSMNGYVSSTASLKVKGVKTTLSAQPPQAAYFDLGILAASPIRLRRAGFGDVACRSTCEIDVILSHEACATPRYGPAFALQREVEQRLWHDPAAVTQGEAEAIRPLVELLVLSGLGMLWAGTSAPGSQAEHLISHFLDMTDEAQADRFHGEQVALATVAVTELQDLLFAGGLPPHPSDIFLGEADIDDRFGTRAPLFRSILAEKAKNLRERHRALSLAWPRMNEAFLRHCRPTSELRAAFNAIGFDLSPANHGIPHDRWCEAIRFARLIRDRWTCLDLADETGRLAPFLESWGT